MVQRFQNDDQVMNCLYCQGAMVRGSAPLHIARKDVRVSLDSVPAWVCSQCGEVYFEETEVNAVQNIILAVDEQTGKLVSTAWRLIRGKGLPQLEKSG